MNQPECTYTPRLAAPYTTDFVPLSSNIDSNIDSGHGEEIAGLPVGEVAVPKSHSYR